MKDHKLREEDGMRQVPDCIYIKGIGKFSIGQGAFNEIDLSGLRQGIGLFGEDPAALCWMDVSGVKKVIVIENWTTFFCRREKNSIQIYLGGDTDQISGEWFQKIYRELPGAEYFYWGDVETEGFERCADLRRKSGLPFQFYLIGAGD